MENFHHYASELSYKSQEDISYGQAFNEFDKKFLSKESEMVQNYTKW